MPEAPPITMTRIPSSDIAASVIVHLLQNLRSLRHLMPIPALSEIGRVIDIGTDAEKIRSLTGSVRALERT
jgi:hypothetical protein